MLTGAEKFVYSLCAALFGATVLILYAPIFVSALLSLVPQAFGNMQWRAISIAAYTDLFANVDMMQSLGDSLRVALSAAVIASVAAILLALYFDSRIAIGKSFVEALIYLPFIMPSIITGLSLLLYFSALDIPLNLLTVTTGHAIFVLAIVYRLTSVRLANMSPTLREASRDLGANGWETFRHVTFPHLKPAVIAGVMFAAAISIDETLITLFLSGDRMTLPIRLWSLLRVGFTQEIYALVTLVILGTLVLALLGIRSWKKSGVTQF